MRTLVRRWSVDWGPGLLLWVTNKPFGALGGYIEITELARLRRRPRWRTYFTLGIVAGGLLSAAAGAGWHPTLSYGSFDQLFGASLLVKGAILVASSASWPEFSFATAGACRSSTAREVSIRRRQRCRAVRFR